MKQQLENLQEEILNLLEQMNCESDQSLTNVKYQDMVTQLDYMTGYERILITRIHRESRIKWSDDEHLGKPVKVNISELLKDFSDA